MIGATLRVVLADDERPARAFLLDILRGYEDIRVVGEAADGAEAVRLIEELRPDLALLDLQMPGVGGLDVVRLLRREQMPLVAFVTAYDEHAVRAFEVNAIDYLLKPVEPARLRATLNRAQERLERAEYDPTEVERLRVAAVACERAAPPLLRRIPARSGEDIVLLPVDQVVSIEADGPTLRITTAAGQRHAVTYRLKDLEGRLAPDQFVRLSRGVLVQVDQLQRVSPMPGGTYLAILRNGQRFPVSRLRARILRDQLFRL
jgi:two-component system LytT family response regulator